MKSILSGLIVIFLFVTLLPFNGLAAEDSSNDEEETLFPGTVFASIEELESAITAYRQKPIVYGGDVDNFFASAKSIYVPVEFVDKASSIKQVVTFPSYFEIQYVIDEKIYLFGYYYTKRSGEWLINSTEKNYFDNKSPKNLAKKYRWGEKLIYSYYTPEFSYTASDLGESYYIWTQNNKGFYWRMPDRKPDKKYVSWCDVVSVPLKVEPSSRVEQSVNNAGENPITGK